MDAAQLWQWQTLGGDPGDIAWLLNMDEAGALLGDGLVVTFTLRVENWGTVTATGAAGRRFVLPRRCACPPVPHLPAERRGPSVP
jgi:hypothetical protein